MEKKSKKVLLASCIFIAVLFVTIMTAAIFTTKSGGPCGDLYRESSWMANKGGPRGPSYQNNEKFIQDMQKWGKEMEELHTRIDACMAKEGFANYVEYTAKYGDPMTPVPDVRPTSR